MNTSIFQHPWFFRLAVILFLIGTIDPLEGSVLIAAGGIMMAIHTRLVSQPQARWYLAASILIIAGVIYMFYVSSLGGFGGNSGRSWWWATPILPYPIGWLIVVILLLTNVIKKQIHHRKGLKTEPNPG